MEEGKNDYVLTNGMPFPIMHLAILKGASVLEGFILVAMVSSFLLEKVAIFLANSYNVLLCAPGQLGGELPILFLKWWLNLRARHWEQAP